MFLELPVFETEVSVAEAIECVSSLFESTTRYIIKTDMLCSSQPIIPYTPTYHNTQCDCCQRPLGTPFKFHSVLVDNGVSISPSGSSTALDCVGGVAGTLGNSLVSILHPVSVPGSLKTC